MKIRFKLIAALILTMILPIVVLSVFSSSKYTKMLCNDQISALKNNNADKAAYVTEFLLNVNERNIFFTADSNVRRFTSEAVNGNHSDSYDEYMSYTNEKIKDTVKKSENVLDMFIIDDNGTVLAAFDDSAVGTTADNHSELRGFSGKNNGISYIYPPKNGSFCYIYAVRRIYSETNQRVGYVCQKIDIEPLGEQLKLTGYSGYANSIIIDSSGKFIMSSVSNPKPLEDMAEYKGIAENLSEVIPFYGETGVKETLSAEYDYFSVCGNVVSGSNWSVVSIFNKKEAKSFISTNADSRSIAAIVAAVLSAALIVVISLKYTYPIHAIIDVMEQHKKGNTQSRLEFKSNDEFGEISSTFNAMLDSIAESEQRYQAVVSMSDSVVFEVNLKTFKVFVSNNFNQRFSFRAKDDSISESFLYKMKIHKDDMKRYHDELERMVSSSGEKWEGEYRLKNIYGDFCWVRVKAKKFMGRNNTPEKIIGTLTDIDREKKSAINLMQKANYDALTQLYNRASFLRALDEEMSLSGQRRSLDALMFIDLDDFKHFNDEFGHKCGDEVLKFVADTIKEVTFDKGFGGRLGGDEFVMCLTNLKLIGDAGKAASEVITVLDQGFISESCGEKFNIHCSIGIAFFRENGDNSTELLESADSAMYRIKKSGKSNFAYAGRDVDLSPSPIAMVDPMNATFDNTFLR